VSCLNVYFRVDLYPNVSYSFNTKSNVSRHISHNDTASDINISDKLRQYMDTDISVRRQEHVGRERGNGKQRQCRWKERAFTSLRPRMTLRPKSIHEQGTKQPRKKGLSYNLNFLDNRGAPCGLGKRHVVSFCCIREMGLFRWPTKLQPGRYD